MQKKWEGGRLGPPRGGGTRPGSRGPHPPAAPSLVTLPNGLGACPNVLKVQVEYCAVTGPSGHARTSTSTSTPSTPPAPT